MSAAKGQVVTGLTLSTLKSLQNDALTRFGKGSLYLSAEDLNNNKPVLPWHRKVPHHLDDGSAPTFHATVKEHYRAIYFEGLDLVTSCRSL